MVRQSRHFVTGLICGILLITFLGVAVASPIEKNITALYNNIKIYVDGNLVTPKDVNGKIVEPFIYEGTTYLPVRAVGEALNKMVDWDGSTQSIYIGVRPGVAIRLSEQVRPYQKSSYYAEYPDEGSFKMAGNQYYNGVTAHYSGAHALYNLDSKYEQLSGVYGPIDGTTGKSCEINFYGDGKLLKCLESQYGDMPKDFSVNLQGVMQLKIEFSGSSKFALANVEVK